MDISELQKLDETVLKILNSSEAIMTNQPDDLNIEALYTKIHNVYIGDQEAVSKEKSKAAAKYESILNTVIFFVNDEDYTRCTQLGVDKKPKVEEEDPSKHPIERFLEDLKEWGGVKSDEILCKVKKEDFSNETNFVA